MQTCYRMLTKTPGAIAILLLFSIPLGTLGWTHSHGQSSKALWWFPEDSREIAPYKATPMNVVERMLELAEVQRGDVVYDLGSGDGRILITAARKYGARGVGLEINRRLVHESRAAIRHSGVENLVEIREQDIMTADFSGASVVTLYLLPEVNALLRPVLERQLRPGVRVVSTDFPIGEWEPDHVEEMRSLKGHHYTLFLWRVPGPEEER